MWTRKLGKAAIALGAIVVLGQPTPALAAEQADLAISLKALGTRAIAPGETAQYEIVVSNAGPSTAKDVRVLDTLPEMLMVVASKPDGCQRVGSVLTCLPLPELAAGKSGIFQLTVRLDAAYQGDGSEIELSALVTADTDDPQYANNVTSPDDGRLPAGGAANPRAELSATKRPMGPIPTQAGATVKYEVILTNHGPSVARNAVVYDDVPGRMSYVSSSPAGCTHAGGSVTCPPVPVLAVGESAKFILTMKING